MFISVCAIFSGCAQNHEWTESPGRAMDRVAKGLEEYGSVTMSAPLLSRPDTAFNFDLKRGTDKYFTEAKTDIQGAAANFEQISQSFAFGAAVQTDPTILAAYAAKLRQYSADQSRIDQKQSLVDSAAKIDYMAAVQKALAETDPQKKAAALAAAERSYSQNLSPPSTSAPVFPNISSASNTPSAPSGLAKQPTDALNVLSSNKFKDFQGLLSSVSPSLTPTVSNRSALITAAGDQAVEGIFKVLGNQGDAQKFKDKAVLFGVTMVSVDPGWRTREDFAADISVTIHYNYVPARKEVIELLLKDNKLTGGLRKRIAADYQMESFLPSDLNKDYEAILTDLTESRDRDKDKIQKDISKEKATKSQLDAAITMIKSKIAAKNIQSKLRKQFEKQLKNYESELKTNEAKIKELEKQEIDGDNVFKNKNKSIEKEKKALEDEKQKSISKPLPDWLNYAENDEVNPIVSAISPMTETEALDLSSSFRRQDEMAISLSFALRYAGLGAQAEAFEQFVKSRQSDVRTRSASAAINSYSASGGMFGFQIGPRLRAIADPSSTKSGPGNILERQSFPVLVVIGFDRDDLRPKIKVDCNNKVQVYEPNLSFIQTTQWLPLTNKWFSWRDWYRPSDWFNPRLSERERLEWSAGLNITKDLAIQACRSEINNNNLNYEEISVKCEKYDASHMDKITIDICKCLKKYRGVQKVADAQTNSLRYHAFGSGVSLAIPAEFIVPLDDPKKNIMPQLTQITPGEITLTRKKDGSIETKRFMLVITGTGLDAVNLKGVKVVTGSASLVSEEGKSPLLVGGAIVLGVDVKGGDTPIMFGLPLDPTKSGLGTDDKPVSVLTLPVSVSVPSAKVNAAPVKKTTKTMSYDKTSDGTGKKDNITITLDSGLPAAAVNAAKSIIEADIQKNKPASGSSPNISVTVQADNPANKTK
jgi:hypothetical protein